jgi:hypothetical protein
MTLKPHSDATGKNAEQRFVELRKYFLDYLALMGHARPELYNRPKLGDAREPTEEELVRRWAYRLDVPVNDIVIGINRAFARAFMAGGVTNFRDCLMEIGKRVDEVRSARAKEGWAR